MLMVPEWIPQELFRVAVEQVGAKTRPARLHDIRLEELSEGRCVQTMHIGSFDTEAETLAQLHHHFIPGNRLRMTGKHHEIYLNDFRKVPPDRQRTLLRQPVDDADQ